MEHGMILDFLCQIILNHKRHDIGLMQPRLMGRDELMKETYFIEAVDS